MSLSYSKKRGITIANALYLVFCTKNVVWQKIFSLLSLFNATSQKFVNAWLSRSRSLKFFVLELIFPRRAVYHLPIRSLSSNHNDQLTKQIYQMILGLTNAIQSLTIDILIISILEIRHNMYIIWDTCYIRNISLDILRLSRIRDSHLLYSSVVTHLNYPSIEVKNQLTFYKMLHFHVF